MKKIFLLLAVISNIDAQTQLDDYELFIQPQYIYQGDFYTVEVFQEHMKNENYKMDGISLIYKKYTKDDVSIEKGSLAEAIIKKSYRYISQKPAPCSGWLVRWECDWGPTIVGYYSTFKKYATEYRVFIYYDENGKNHHWITCYTGEH
jgi:hypothetical protein